MLPPRFSLGWYLQPPSAAPVGVVAHDEVGQQQQVVRVWRRLRAAASHGHSVRVRHEQRVHAAALLLCRAGAAC